jgi:hypothetical protein
VSLTARLARLGDRHERTLLGGSAVAVFLLAWELAGRAGLVSPIFLS